MKKVTFLLTSAILSCVALTGLVSCSGDGGSGGDDNIYDITYVEDENYTVTGLSATGQEGSNITFDVTSNSVFYEIGDVLFNGEATTKDWFGYEFIMPDEDVEITVELIPVTSYDDEDDYLSWGSSVIDKISVAKDKTVSYPVPTSLPLFFDMTKFGYYNTEIDATFLSSNEEVIPTDALTFEPTMANGNLLRGGSITVDLKKINLGTASIYFRFDSNNADEAELIRTFTVTEYGTIELEYWDVEFTYDNRSDFSDLENIQISFHDENFIYGNSVANEYQSFTLADLVEESFTLKYIIGHEYSISASHAIYDEDSGHYTDVTALEIYDWMGTGSSSTGFNQIIDGVLTLVSLPTAPIEIVLS